MKLVIFGAQGIALGACEAIRGLYPARRVECFVVSSRGINACRLAGLEVVELSAYAGRLSEEEKNDVEILIATPENVMPQIERELDEKGLLCHVRLTSRRLCELQGYYHGSHKRFLPLSALPVGYHRAGLHVFKVRTHKDKTLTETYQNPEWLTPIQAGAIGCRERVANILDCEGEHISGKNGNYCELTALYWIWKNRLTERWSGDGEGYYGLCHYRRMLELTEDDILRLTDNDVDVVLPFPMPYEPDMGAHHRRYLSEGDLEALRAALKELYPDYAAALAQIESQPYLYNYNIILARKKVLKDYCSWLFPLLERIEQRSIPMGSERADRYLGYMGESLCTLYFIVNKDRLTIMHSGCRFLK